MSSLAQFAKAITRGNSSIVESLISRGLVDVNARLSLEARPPALVHAASCGRKAIVDILLRFNARVDDTDENGWTACHVAAAGRRHEVLALLLARQPNLAVVNADGQTALSCAMQRCENEGGRSALMLLEAGASLEAVGRDDLCSFASTSTVAIQLLVNHGVVLRDVVNAHGITPLHLAAWRVRDADVFHMLVNVCGIDLDAACQSGLTCILLAASAGNDFAVGWLIKAGADVNVACNGGATPLHCANNRDCVVLLLAGGASVCSRGNYGGTMLHSASSMYVHAFLAAGADLDVRDGTGETARQALARRYVIIEPDEVDAARREIAKARLDFVRYRALEVCIGLQSRCIDALQMCEILLFACGRVAQLIPFHVWWTIATTVKHFRTS